MCNLSGKKLNFAVELIERGGVCHTVRGRDDPVLLGILRDFSNDWAHGGPIIERELITVEVLDSCAPRWVANTSREGERYTCEGESALEAAMRCYVLSMSEIRP